jgi:hypothetical protein
MKNLKNIIFIAIIIISYGAVVAQEVTKPIENYLTDRYCEFPNTYYKDTNNKLQNLVGTWEYNNGIHYFKITFSKAKTLVNEYHSVYADVLYTEFLYKKNNIVIYDNYGITNYNLNNTVNQKPSNIESTFVKNSNISFLYTEPSTNNCHRRKVGRLNILYISNSGFPQIQWNRSTDTGYFDDMPCDNGLEPDNSDFVIPANMTLNKI